MRVMNVIEILTRGLRSAISLAFSSPLRSSDHARSDHARQVHVCGQDRCILWSRRGGGSSDPARQVRLLGQESAARDGGVVRHWFDDCVLHDPPPQAATPYLSAGGDILRSKTLQGVIFFGFLMSTAIAATLPQTPTDTAYQGDAFATIIPKPQEQKDANGILPLENLSIKLEGNAQELVWAARDLNEEMLSRLGKTLELKGSAKTIRIGTLENAALSGEAKTRGILPDKAESYGLWVDDKGVGVVGFDAIGAYRGAQSLRQLLTPTGFKFSAIRDYPSLQTRVAMIYLDVYSKPTNDWLIPMLAKLKFSSVLVMCNYVKWDSTKNIWHPNGASKAEAIRVAELIRSHGMDAIPLIETPGHANWLFYNNQNRDIAQDPEIKEPYAYDTLNPRTYEILLPIFSEAVEVFKPKFVHLGHDEVIADGRGRFPARENGIAVGFEKLFLDDTIKLHDHLKSLGVGTMIWHDVALSEAHRDKILPELPKDIVLANWHYGAADDYPSIKYAQSQGFRVLGASWFPTGNPEKMSQAVARENALGAIQTRWTGYFFSNIAIYDGNAEQGAAYFNAASSFWNVSAPMLENLESARRYRDAYKNTKYAPIKGTLIDLSSLVTRKLADTDETQWVQKGSSTDLSSLPTGANVKLGANTFNISGAIMLRGARAAVQDLPEKITLEIGAPAAAINFLHTTGWLGTLTSPRQKVGAYTITYTDGTTVIQPLEYGRNINAWTEPSVENTVRSIINDPIWRGKTSDGLEIGLNVFTWVNPNPAKTIASIEFSSEATQANPTLIGMTLLEKAP
jgi:hexosaminidase